MSEDPVPYNPAPAKPAQPSIADLYAEIKALRKENDELRSRLDAEAHREEAAAFDPKAPSIHDLNAVLVGQTTDGVKVRASSRGWSAEGPGINLVVTRDASPYANYQAAVARLARVGIVLGAPQLDAPERPATVPSDATDVATHR
jgi:hypothetical protein